MSYAIDTNVLMRSIEEDHVMHPDALGAILSLLAGGAVVCVLAQNLYEFWVAATRLLANNGLGLIAVSERTSRRYKC